MYAYIHTYICICIYIYMYIVNIYIYNCMYVCIYTHLHRPTQHPKLSTPWAPLQHRCLELSNPKPPSNPEPCNPNSIVLVGHGRRWLVRAWCVDLHIECCQAIPLILPRPKWPKHHSKNVPNTIRTALASDMELQSLSQYARPSKLLLSLCILILDVRLPNPIPLN